MTLTNIQRLYPSILFIVIGRKYQDKISEKEMKLCKYLFNAFSTLCLVTRTYATPTSSTTNHIFFVISMVPKEYKT